MADPVNPFTVEPQKLARNPLGILAMFLLLVYGIAGLAFGATASTLTARERVPIIWFLVGFPVLMLGTFAWLVTRHHSKLYAPTDFHDPDGFFRAMQLRPQTVPERKVRLDREVQEVRLAGPTLRPSVALREPEAGKLRSDVVLAEELAFRAVEAEFGRPILRHVRAASDVQVDGVFQLADREVALEVKFARTSDWERFAQQALTLSKSFTGKGRVRPVTVLLVVVADGLSGEQRAAAAHRLERYLEGAGPAVKLRVFDFAALKQEFGITG